MHVLSKGNCGHIGKHWHYDYVWPQKLMETQAPCEPMTEGITHTASSLFPENTQASNHYVPLADSTRKFSSSDGMHHLLHIIDDIELTIDILRLAKNINNVNNCKFTFRIRVFVRHAARGIHTSDEIAMGILCVELCETT